MLGCVKVCEGRRRWFWHPPLYPAALRLSEGFQLDFLLIALSGSPGYNSIYLESGPANIFRSLSDYFETRKSAPEIMFKSVLVSSKKYENQCAACERCHSVISNSSFSQLILKSMI